MLTIAKIIAASSIDSNAIHITASDVLLKNTRHDKAFITI